jgi:hypothetical protein
MRSGEAMKPRRAGRTLAPLAVCGLCLAALLFDSITAEGAEIRAEERITVSSPPGLSPATARRFADLLVEERRRVRAWWGPSFEEPILVKVTDERGPSMALVPGWRGERGTMLMPVQRVKSNDAASLHELVHIYAPNGNRFLAEGLSVYAHEALRGRPAHPNFGRDLHEMARERTEKISLAVLDKVPTPNDLGRQAEPVEAYVAAGSFVRFLVERHGMEQFRALYDLTPLIPNKRAAGSPERWRTVYGQPLEDLEAAWRQFLKDEIRAPVQTPATKKRD